MAPVLGRYLYQCKTHYPLDAPSRSARRAGLRATAGAEGLMPLAPLRPCPVPSCPTLVRSGRCDRHGGQRQPWQHDTPSQRIRGAQLQRLRAKLFKDEPLCRACQSKGRTTIATIRDHVVPLAEGGQDVETNTQPLCRECSDTKTHRESKRGQKRNA